MTARSGAWAEVMADGLDVPILRARPAVAGALVDAHGRPLSAPHRTAEAAAGGVHHRPPPPDAARVMMSVAHVAALVLSLAIQCAVG